MAGYTRGEARDWARENFTGVNNVIIPSFSNDLKDINESGIRHDVRLNIDNGFAGCLLVSEAGTTLDEYERFVQIARDEAGDRQLLLHHAVFNTLEESIEAAQRSARAGADLVLLGYPPSFYPSSQREIVDYTKRFCDAVGLGVMLFPISFWGFERLHPASIAVETLDELVDEVPNIVAIKAEGGHPSISGFAQVWHRFSARVVVSFPIIQEAISLASLVPMQVVATSNTEYYGNAAPRMFDLLQDGKAEEALALLWQIAPAWRANESASPIPNAHFVHRMAWKYQAWLAGYNGGPMRMPTLRLSPASMRSYRQALVASHLDVTEDDDSAFFVGRNPTGKA